MSCWTDYWTVDINKTNVSKGNSVFWLCNHLGISVNDALVFGDGDNDKSMFEVVNKGIAVGNAIDKLKVLSKDVALDCKDNGIYKYIEDNILR
jgi:hydroxymethylpyrimidine pyrophosphatase-like HAD family hydrolase